ncbi:MAG: Txe/YoeB family addiction module toxin [Treponemataceae bacterium]|nr:MAG: Txe/YoeB family addiction module toxin [Treponemataceae bacterium]
MTVSFADDAWSEYTEWQNTDKNILRRINELIKDIQRNGFMKGLGKPEALKGRKAFSRRIDDVHRLVYTGDENQNLKILSCKGHYE